MKNVDLTKCVEEKWVRHWNSNYRYILLPELKCTLIHISIWNLSLWCAHKQFILIIKRIPVFRLTNPGQIRWKIRGHGPGGDWWRKTGFRKVKTILSQSMGHLGQSKLMDNKPWLLQWRILWHALTSLFPLSFSLVSFLGFAVCFAVSAKGTRTRFTIEIHFLHLCSCLQLDEKCEKQVWK